MNFTKMSNPVQPSKKVFDVTRPGKTPPAATSRPVIVGHKPEVHDALIGGSSAKVGAAKDKRPLLNALAKVTIRPAEPVVPEPENTDTPPPPQAPMPSVAPVPKTPPRAPALPVSPSIVLPQEPQVPPPSPLSEKLLDAAEKEPENPNPMTQHGNQVYVSHHKSRLTFGNALLVILFIVILTTIAVNFLLDGGIIKTELNVPHTNWL